MSWEDTGGDGNPDHNPKGMQACTFERDDQVQIFQRKACRIKEGVELVGYLVDTFILKHIKEYFVYMLEYVKIDWDEFNRTPAKHNEQYSKRQRFRGFKEI